VSQNGVAPLDSLVTKQRDPTPLVAYFIHYRSRLNERVEYVGTIYQ
jgi:hypothetical protein